MLSRIVTRASALSALLALTTFSPAMADDLTAQKELPDSPEAGAGGYHQPPDRADIPDGPFGDAVRRGRQAFTNTREKAGRYVGNAQNCSNCHLGEGTAPNSAPLWAAWPVYPKYRGKNDHVNTMDERIRGCFTYSMNAGDSRAGHTPEPESQVLKDMQAYMFWMAEGVPTGKNMPGRGYQSVPKPDDGYDVAAGKKVYKEQCAICHGDDGDGHFTEKGKQVFPPLWGSGAYNWGAGMHRVNTAAAFIKYNMPLGKANPVTDEAALSDQQAWDVAAYINSHERPPDPRQDGSISETRDQSHEHDCLYGSRQRGEVLGSGMADADSD